MGSTKDAENKNANFYYIPIDPKRCGRLARQFSITKQTGKCRPIGILFPVDEVTRIQETRNSILKKYLARDFLPKNCSSGEHFDNPASDPRALESRSCESPESGIDCDENFRSNEVLVDVYAPSQNLLCEPSDNAEFDLKSEKQPSSPLREQSVRKENFLSTLGLLSVPSNILEKAEGGLDDAPEQLQIDGVSVSRKKITAKACKESYENRNKCGLKHRKDKKQTEKATGIKIRRLDYEQNDVTDRGAALFCHILLERQRRRAMRTAFQRLRLEAGILEGKAPKIRILTIATTICRDLKLDEIHLIAEKNGLATRSSYLKARLKDFQASASVEDSAKIQSLLSMIDEKNRCKGKSEEALSCSTSLAEEVVIKRSVSPRRALLDHSYFESHDDEGSTGRADEGSREPSNCSDEENESDVDVVSIDTSRPLTPRDKLINSPEKELESNITHDDIDNDFQIVNIRSLSSDKPKCSSTNNLDDKQNGSDVETNGSRKKFAKRRNLPQPPRLRVRTVTSKGGRKRVLMLDADYHRAIPLPSYITNRPPSKKLKTEAELTVKKEQYPEPSCGKKASVASLVRNILSPSRNGESWCATDEVPRSECDEVGEKHRSCSRDNVQGTSQIENNPQGKIMPGLSKISSMYDSVKKMERRQVNSKGATAEENSTKSSTSGSQFFRSKQLKKERRKLFPKNEKAVSVGSHKATLHKHAAILESRIEKGVIDTLPVIKQPTIKLTRLKLEDNYMSTEITAPKFVASKAEVCRPKPAFRTVLDDTELLELGDVGCHDHVSALDDNFGNPRPEDVPGTSKEIRYSSPRPNAGLSKIELLRARLRQQEANLENIRKTIHTLDDDIPLG